MCLAVTGSSGIAAGQDAPKKSDPPAVRQPVESVPTTATDPLMKKKAVWLAFAMWAGIIFGGVILLALVVMWGNRTRRLARSPLPPIAKRDELWFLKPKPSADDAEPAGPVDPGSNGGPSR
jgi:hypothetical protein